MRRIAALATGVASLALVVAPDVVERESDDRVRWR